MQQIDAGFEAQMARIGAKRAEVEAVLANCTVDEAEAMRCMYAGMPVSDAAECEPELLLKFAKIFLYFYNILYPYLIHKHNIYCL